jgi:hypothetical protein
MPVKSPVLMAKSPFANEFPIPAQPNGIPTDVPDMCSTYVHKFPVDSP